MTFITVEGIDGVGKTTLVKELHEKYKDVGIISFPQNREILQVKYDRNNLDEIMGYHKMFLKDFEKTQQSLKSLVHNYDIVIADRYTGSYITYLIYDVFYYKAVVTRMNQFDIVDYLDKISEEKSKEIDKLIKPDYTLLLYNYDPNLDRMDGTKQSMFTTALTMLNQKYSTIEALKRDTFKQVIDELKEKKYIGDLKEVEV